MNYSQKVVAVLGILTELTLLVVRPAYWRNLRYWPTTAEAESPVPQAEGNEISFATIVQINKGKIEHEGVVFEIIQATDYWIGAMVAVALITLLGMVVFSDSNA